MYPVSDTWDFAIRHGAQRVSYADLYYPPSSPFGSPVLSDLPIESFNITVDRRADIERTGTMKITSEALLNELKASVGVSPLEPYGSEIRIRHGVVNGDGTEETVPCGVFGIETLQYTEPGAAMDFTLVGREAMVKRRVYGFPADAGGRDALQSVTDTINGITPFSGYLVGAGVTSHVIPGGVTFRGDWLAIIRDLVESMGAEFYYDQNGVAHIVKVPEIPAGYAGPANWVVDCGDTGVMIENDIDITRTDTFNRIIVVGVNPTATQAAVFADVSDQNPASPTYYNGPFGQSDKWIDDNTLTTPELCLNRANAELANHIGLSKNVNLKSLSNVALEPRDIIEVVTMSGTREWHLVDSYTTDHTGTMSIKTRTTRVVV